LNGKCLWIDELMIATVSVKFQLALDKMNQEMNFMERNEVESSIRNVKITKYVLFAVLAVFLAFLLTVLIS
jgi:hypothetical protein